MCDKIRVKHKLLNYRNLIQMYLILESNNKCKLLSSENFQNNRSLNSNLSEGKLQSTRVVAENQNHLGQHETGQQHSVVQLNSVSSTVPLNYNPTRGCLGTVHHQKTIAENSNSSSLDTQAYPKPPQEREERSEELDQTKSCNSYNSNEKFLQKINTEKQKMRPYKKRSFLGQLQSSANKMEAENSDDSEKQTSSSPPIEDIEKDKDKESETKRRKKWKRKISRKQFRHHDIKLFTPKEYRSTSLLKHKDSSPTVPKKPDVASKESITDLIVTTLGGQKQKKAGEEVADSTTKNDVEENNNTNDIQNNNNNVGKHHLPAIIIETPNIRRRSVDNTNIPKSNFKTTDQKFDRRMSVDMPLLYTLEQISKNPEAQPPITNVRQEQTSIRNSETRINADGQSHVNRKDFGELETSRYSVEHVPREKIHNFNQKVALSIPMEQNYFIQNAKNNGHVENSFNAQRLQEHLLQPMDTPTDEQPVEPENLSLKRRLSLGDNPVDLSTKSAEHVDQPSKHYSQKLHQNGDRINVSSKKRTENSYRPLDYQHQNSSVVVTSSQKREYVRNTTGDHLSKSPEVLRPTFPYSKESEPQDQTQNKPHASFNDTVKKIKNLNMWQKVLQDLLSQRFSLETLDQLAHAYGQIDLAQNEMCVPPEIKLKAQKLLSEAYGFISDKLQQLNFEVNPGFVIKVLGQMENTAEKTTLKHYMENIESIRKLAIDEATAIVTAVSMSQVPHLANYLQNYRVPTTSPSTFSTEINPLYRRSSRDSYLSSEPSHTSTHSSPAGHFQSTNHASPPGHSMILNRQSGQSSRAAGHNTSPGYLRGISPKTGNHLVSGGQSRETSPRIGDHPMSMVQAPRIENYSIQQRRSRGPSPGTNEHSVPPRPPPRIEEYSFPQGHPRDPSPKAGGHHRPMEIPLQSGNYSVSQNGSRGPSPRTNEQSVPSGLPQRVGDYHYPHGYTRGPSPKTGEHPMAYGHHPGPLPRHVEYPVTTRNSMETYKSTGNHTLLLGQSGQPFLRPGGEFMHQAVSQRLRPRPDMPLDRTSEPHLRTSNPFMAPGSVDRLSERSSDHSMYTQFQNSNPYNMSYVSNINNFLTQAGPKEPTTRSPGVVGRPRSKSHRSADVKSLLQQQLKRSLSNPQHTPMEIKQPHLESTISRMPPPRVPTSTHNFQPALQPNNNLPPQLPNLVQNKEVPISQSASAPSKPTVPTIYSEVFYRNLQNHAAKENPLSVSVYPSFKSDQKKVPDVQPNLRSLGTNQTQKRVPNLKEVHEKIPKEHYAPTESSTLSIPSATEEKISSSTDHIKISKVTNLLTKTAVTNKVQALSSVSPKPPETLKSIPVAVIVADHSMQITKETKSIFDKGQRTETSTDLPKAIDAGVSISSDSNDIFSSEENLIKAFDKEQEENNTEFLVWLEKLKSNEKLKSRFLTQMGIIKKEEPPFTVGGDPIEIVDSDEEDTSAAQRIKTQSEQKSPSLSEATADSPKESITIDPNKNDVPYKSPTQITNTSNNLENNQSSTELQVSEVSRNSSPKQSLSKKGYIPPIPLPYVPTSTGQKLTYSPAPKEKGKIGIYSPQIEPISPVGNIEASFVFPEVAHGPQLLPPLRISSSDSSTVFSDGVTSPTYQKRKDFSGYQNEERSTKTDYSNDNKRRKSLERPEVTRSPRVAPSGKLCYVRESHMFLRYFDDTQVELFIRNLSTQDEELLRSTGVDPHTHRASKFALDQHTNTEIIYLPRDVEFSEKEDIPEVEEFIKETSLVEQFVPKDFADFYRYVTGFQIIKNKHPVSLQTFLTMYNTNRTSELLRKYLEKDEVVSRKR